jgi:hypothetical protein
MAAVHPEPWLLSLITTNNNNLGMRTASALVKYYTIQVFISEGNL